MRIPAAIGISIITFVVGVLTAINCHAADWQQSMMLWVLPPVAGAGIGCAVWWSGSNRAFGGMMLGVAVAVVLFFSFIFLLVGACST